MEKYFVKSVGTLAGTWGWGRVSFQCTGMTVMKQGSI